MTFLGALASAGAPFVVSGRGRVCRSQVRVSDHAPGSARCLFLPILQFLQQRRRHLSGRLSGFLGRIASRLSLIHI